MRRKGFVYTLFALFLINLMILVTVLPAQLDRGQTSLKNVDIDELFYFLQSVEDDIDRGAEIAFRRALVASTNIVLDNGTALDDSSGIVAEAFLNGTGNGSELNLMDESSFRDWMAKMEERADLSGYVAGMNVSLAAVDVSMQDAFTVEVSFPYNLSVRDTGISTRFDRDGEQFTGVSSIDGIDDALLMLETEGKRSRQYERCGSSSIASVVSTGAESEYNYTESGSERTWASGDAVIRTGGSLPSEDREVSVLLTDDLCQYSHSDLDEFAGVVSEATTDGQDVCGSGEEIRGYIGDASIDGFAEGDRVVMNQEDAWVTSIPAKLDSGCYLADPDAPDFLDRLEGDHAGSGTGLASFLTVPSLPPEFQEQDESAVDFVYWNGSGNYGGVQKVKGVTDHREWFRLDQQHIDRWNLSDLAY